MADFAADSKERQSNTPIKNGDGLKMNTNIYICCYTNKPLRKNMHKSIPMVFAILALVVLILCSACVSQPPINQTSEKNSGITQVLGPSTSPFISFDDARQNLPSYQPDPENASYFIRTIYYITGLDVDESGNARSWIFGVRHSNGTEMLAYDQNGLINLLWNAPPDAQEIVIDDIVSPAGLFSQNALVIFGDPKHTIPERRDLELKRGIYTITITSGNTSRILTFNATTGELIP
jgi:hypothetical protein